MNDPTRAYIIPLPKHEIRDPASHEMIPPQGAWVPMVGPYGRWWRRCIKWGTVKVGQPPKAEAQEKPNIGSDEPIRSDKRKRTSNKEG